MKYLTSQGKRCVVSLLAIATFLAQAPATHVDAIPDSSAASARRADPISLSGDAAIGRASAGPEARVKAVEAYRRSSMSFEANAGQNHDARVKFLSRGDGYSLFLGSTEVTFALLKHAQSSAQPSKNWNSRHVQAPANSRSESETTQAAGLRIRMLGANKAVKVRGAEELPGKSNYFIGDNSKKWRTDIPTYARVKYESIYPGVDLDFYGRQGQLEYDFIVAPGASFKPVTIAFDGARQIRLDSSGDLLIETAIGEIRQRAPIIYQQTDGEKQRISGGYAIRGEREVGIEVTDYDRTRPLVIDPVFVYSASIGGMNNDSANAVAMDAAGNAYITGVTNSIDFPTVSPFQPGLRTGIAAGNPSDAFVLKLNRSGTTILYSTYLGGGRNDAANAIAVDDAGDAYVTGFAASEDFPTTPGAFQTKASEGGDAFVTKLNPTGSSLAYSTRLGGPAPTFFSPNANVGRGIAVDAAGEAYVAGYTFSAAFPLKRPIQRAFNKGSPFDCCGCLYFAVPASPPLEDAFVTKLNSSGAALAYSTYVGGTGQDEAFAIAVDSSGSAYLTGRTCSPDFPATAPGGASDAFLVKVSSSGREFIFGTRLGGSGNDAGNGVAVDPQGNAYIAGQTTSIDLQTTQSAFQSSLGGSVSYVSNNGGEGWRPAFGLPNAPVNALAIDPTNPLIIYAGLRSGLFKSTDGGNTFRKNPLPGFSVAAIAVDPKNPSTVYTDAFRSTDGGFSWTMMRFPDAGVGCAPAHLLIDPVNSSTLYVIFGFGFCGDVATQAAFFKSTNGGASWGLVRNGLSSFAPSVAVIDPRSPSTLYAIRSDLYRSTDGGNSWSIPHVGNRSFAQLAIDPMNDSTLYLSDPGGNLFKTADGGATFEKLGILNLPINELLVDPIDSSTLYAAVGSEGHGGGAFKSTDGGQTWNITDLVGIPVDTLAIDPVNSARLYAGVGFDADGFVAKSNAAGGAFVYASYLGTRATDSSAGIGVDELGNAYVTGTTFSDRFPMNSALLTTKPSGPFDTAAFTTTLDATGSALLFSTYLGNETSFAAGIAVDAAGKVCVAGTTGSLRIIPLANSAESVHGGFDGFVTKIVSPPHVGGVSVSGKNLLVTGDGFDRGAAIVVDGVEQRTRNDNSRPATSLIGRKAAKNIATGQTVNVRVRNIDGLLSDSFSFTR